MLLALYCCSHGGCPMIDNGWSGQWSSRLFWWMPRNYLVVQGQWCADLFLPMLLMGLANIESFASHDEILLFNNSNLFSLWEDNEHCGHHCFMSLDSYCFHWVWSHLSTSLVPCVISLHIDWYCKWEKVHRYIVTPTPTNCHVLLVLATIFDFVSPPFVRIVC